MGWYIGNETVGIVTIPRIGDSDITTAYLSLTDRYYIYGTLKKEVIDEVEFETLIYKAEVGIAIHTSKLAKESNQPQLVIEGLNSTVAIEITQEEFNTVVTAQLLLGKLVPAIEAVKPEWAGKLVEDF